MSAVVGRFPAILVSIVVITSIACIMHNIVKFIKKLSHCSPFMTSLLMIYSKSLFLLVYYLPVKVFSALSVATYREVDSDDVSEPLLVIEEGGEVGDKDDEDGGHVDRHEVAEDVALEDDLYLVIG